MGILDERVYAPDCAISDTSAEDYYNWTDTFGHFTEDGSTYVIERKDTPRPWLHFMANRHVYACISNEGNGFLRHARGYNITKQWERDWYYTHEPCGKRVIILEIDGKAYDFFADATNFIEYVSTGSAKFVGDVAGVHAEFTLFVPNERPCECWKIHLESATPKTVKVTVEQEWQFDFYIGYDPTPAEVSTDGNVAWARKCGFVCSFGMSGDAAASVSKGFQCRGHKAEDVNFEITTAHLERTVIVDGATDIYVLSGAGYGEEEGESVLDLLEPAVWEAEFAAMQKKWDERVHRNYCKTPNANFDRFVNYWLKNQLQLTFNFDRSHPTVGYRDGLQDSWGYMLVDPEEAKGKLVRTLAHMLPDGRCPRQYYRWADEGHDFRDFSDSITWVGLTLTSYIKETGDVGILDEEIGFLGSDETSTVEEHVLRGLNSLYTLRGKNGLVRMRGGDWLDGLEGMNKYGEDATSVWVTVAAYHAQNKMAELFDFVGKPELAKLMRERSAEYKEVVNRVAWDGNWFVYAFYEDGEPLGGAENLEGKIHANVQTWALLSGIVDDPDRIRRIEKSMNRYLQTPYGPMLMYPPYVFHGERAGRLQRQRPGTFGNGAVYNHAAGFKVFADVARKDYDDALDTFLRAIPNHPDNSDRRRTSEPYAVGNVYYGTVHHRAGMNLFTWWTATVAWLMHGAYEEILGVYADYEGVTLDPHVPIDWDTYSADKFYRGTMYHITFERTDGEKGVWLDGVKQASNTVQSDKSECAVLVKF